MINRLETFATGKNVLIFLALDLILMMGVMPFLGSKMEAVSTISGKPIDLEIPTYSTERAHSMIEGYGEAGREIYQLIELTADIAYPIVYSLAFALLILFLLKKMELGNHWLRWLALIPLVAAFADLGENISIVTMLNQFPVQSDVVAQIAGSFSLVKWCCFFLSLGSILLGLAGWALSGLKRKSNPKIALK